MPRWRRGRRLRHRRPSPRGSRPPPARRAPRRSPDVRRRPPRRGRRIVARSCGGSPGSTRTARRLSRHVPASVVTIGAIESRCFGWNPASSWMWRKPYARRDASNLAQMSSTVPTSTAGDASSSVPVMSNCAAMRSRNSIARRRVRRDSHEPAVHRQCDVVGRLARPRRALVHPADLLLDAFGHEVDDGVSAEHARAQARVHADDRGLATRESQHAWAAAADEEGGMGKLDGLREAVERRRIE